VAARIHRAGDMLERPKKRSSRSSEIHVVGINVRISELIDAAFDEFIW